MARPTIILQPDQLRQAESLAGYGLTNEQIATILGISLSTLKNKPELLAAIKKGQDVAAGHLHKTAYELAVKERNPVMCMFILKCKHGWRDKQEIDVNHSYKPIVITKRNGETIELSKSDKKQLVQAVKDEEKDDADR